MKTFCIVLYYTLLAIPRREYVKRCFTLVGSDITNKSVLGKNTLALFASG